MFGPGVELELFLKKGTSIFKNNASRDETETEITRKFHGRSESRDVKRE